MGYPDQDHPSRRRVLASTAALMSGLPAAAILAGIGGKRAMAAASKIDLTAADGHKFAAWRADPAGTPKGGIVVLHAVFGIAPALGAVCARWADAGYTAIAPSLFDRLGANIVHPYTKDGVDAGSRDYARLTEAQIFADIAACAKATGAGDRVAISGFCTGGSWSWRAGAKSSFAAEVTFYGSHVHTPEYFELEPHCPTIIHYGDKDPVVPMPQVERIRARHPKVEMHIYPGAVHAFANPDQPSYNAAAAEGAWKASIAFMDRHVGTKA